MDICLNGYPERIDDICASLDDHHRIAGRRNGKLAKIRADGECANCRRRVRQCNKFSWLATERRAPIAGASLIINYHLAGVIEDRRTGHGRVAFKRQISQIGTAIKRIGSDIGNATTNGYFSDIGTIVKSRAAEVLKTVGEGEAGQADTRIKGTGSDRGHIGTNDGAAQVRAIIEGIVTDGRHAIGNDDAFQTGAAGKCITPDVRDAVRYNHAGKAKAIFESITVNIGYPAAER